MEYLNRSIKDRYPIIYIDATFIQTSRHTVSREADDVVLGAKSDTTREVWGIYNSPTESSTIGETVFKDLQNRGLKTVRLVVCDNLAGLDTAIEKHYDSRIQKCVLHLKRNVLKRCKKKDRGTFGDGLAQVFQMDSSDDTLEHALQRNQDFANPRSKDYPHLKTFADKEFMPYYFQYLSYHPKIRNRIYTTNWTERLNKGFKRTLKIRKSMPCVESV